MLEEHPGEQCGWSEHGVRWWVVGNEARVMGGAITHLPHSQKAPQVAVSTG